MPHAQVGSACCRPLALLPVGEGRWPGDPVGLNQHLSCSQNTAQHLIGAGPSAHIPQAHPSPSLASKVLPLPP